MSSSLPKTHSSVSPTCDTPQVCKTRRLRLQPLVRPPAAFPALPCRRAGDVVGGFWFARLLGTRWGKASNYHILSIGPPWGNMTSLPSSCSNMPQTQAPGLPSISLPDAGFCLSSRASPCLHSPVHPQVLGHPTLPRAPGGTAPGSRRGPVCQFALYFWDNY